MLWELLTLGKSRTFHYEFYDLNSFFHIWASVYFLSILITLVTFMRDPLKTARGNWAPPLKIIIIIIIIIIYHHHHHHHHHYCYF